MIVWATLYNILYTRNIRITVGLFYETMKGLCCNVFTFKWREAMVYSDFRTAYCSFLVKFNKPSTQETPSSA